ncbi:MAG: helix-turn-helix transcriptional regulator [Cupriavidus sp.]|nr:helix-turn-helix transcriptional regulator [Cupriavidus sp.]
MSIALQTELESARRAAGISQQQLASRAGLSRMTVQRTESREIDPKLSTVIEMARALGMDVMLVPTTLRPDLETFVRSGGRYLAQPPGSDAPPSIVDTLIEK